MSFQQNGKISVFPKGKTLTRLKKCKLKNTGKMSTFPKESTHDFRQNFQSSSECHFLSKRSRNDVL